VLPATRILLTIVATVQGIATVAIDLNRTHATNPIWPGHSRFHVVWQSLNQPLFAAIAVSLIWWHGPHSAERFYLACLLTAVPCLGFVLAQAFRGAYQGTLSDPNGIPPLRFQLLGRIVQVDGNAAAVYVALMVLTALAVIFHHATGAV
jgi:hypothetical protein